MKETTKTILYLAVLLFGLAFIAGCSLDDNLDGDTTLDSLSIPAKSEIYYSYGPMTIVAGMESMYCYVPSDLESLKNYAKQNAIANWEEYTSNFYDQTIIWGLAIERSVKYPIDPSFTGPNYYFVYAQAWGKPLYHQIR